jgi:hypothetical protein
MKVKLVREIGEGKEIFITMHSVPRVGEHFAIGPDEIMEVIQVVHTPTSEQQDAIVHLRNTEEEA